MFFENIDYLNCKLKYKIPNHSISSKLRNKPMARGRVVSMRREFESYRGQFVRKMITSSENFSFEFNIVVNPRIFFVCAFQLNIEIFKLQRSKIIYHR